MLDLRAKELLDRWRELERQLEQARADQRAALIAEIERIRDEHRTVVEHVMESEPGLDLPATGEA